jgi:dienelactone hydrolase
MRKILVVLLLMGCSKGNEDGPGSGDIGLEVDADADADADDTGEPVALPLMNGLYASGFSVGPVAGLVVALQLEFEMSADVTGGRSIDTITLRAANEAGEVSPDLSAANAIAVGTEGQISVDWPSFILPAAFSPTSGDVEIDAVMVGTIESEDSACGEVTGEIVSFGMDLAGSTFGTIRWENRILGTPSGCSDAILEPVDRIVDCPTMSAGRTMDFPSGGEAREFVLQLPEIYDGDTPTPLVFVLHGIGGTIDGMLSSDNLLDEASRTGHIVVAPQALDRGGTAAWDPVGMPDFNLDVVLFDDLLTCLSEQFPIDPTRVHVTGMSLGGIFTGTLISARSDVIASAAPFSGGLFQAKNEGWQPIPTLVSWGGVEDIYYDQDFDGLAGSMIDTLRADGHFVIGCDHGGGHSLRTELWPSAFQFFIDHPQGIDSAPYLSSGLPAAFPEYCAIAD